MVRREPYRLASWITYMCHHSLLVDNSNLEDSETLTRCFRFFIVFRAVENSVSLLSAACLIVIIAGWKCQDSRVFPLLRLWRPGLDIFRLLLYLYIITSHHPPHKTGQLPGNSSFGNIGLFVFCENHFIIPTS